MKWSAALIVLFVMAGVLQVKGQYFPKDKPTTPSELNTAILALKRSKLPQEKLGALLQLSSCYLFKPDEEKHDLDSALLLAQQAKNLSRTLNDKHGFEAAAKLIVGCYHEGKDLNNTLLSIKTLSLAGQIEMNTYIGDSYFWIAYGKKPTGLIHLDTGLLFYEQKLLASKKLKAPKYIKQSIGHLEHLILMYSEEKSYASAQKQLKWLMENTRTLGLQVPSGVLAAKLGRLEIDKGNYEEALKKTLYAISTVQNGLSNEDKLWIYMQATEIYRFMGKHEKSNFYYFKLLDIADKDPALDVYTVAYFIYYNYRLLNRLDAANAFFQDFQKRYKPRSAIDRFYFHSLLAEHYIANKQDGLALKSLLAAKAEYNEKDQTTSGLFVKIGMIYDRLGRYKEADESYEQCEQMGSPQHASFKAGLYYRRALIKAKLGNYRSALLYINKNKQIADSIFTVSKEKHTQELDVQYETQSKEAQLKQRAELIRFLDEQNKLQHQNTALQAIKLNQAEQLAEKNKTLVLLRERDLKLRSKDLRSVNQIASLQRIQLAQGDFTRDIAIAVIGLLLLIIGLIFYRSRQKHLINFIVKQKNEQLSSLLTEKEWLLKEVHHRVKNNLQTIVNLLESQSDHLEEPAYSAIETSKNRIFAMALLHHKLYQEEESSTIDMSVYINELVCFLRDTFSAHAIVFQVDVAPIGLDIGRAIPIGLIINEAVTNSLKHAFTANTGGTISISFTKENAELAQLTISDNGPGISHQKLSDSPATMGLKLIRGLTVQLNAEVQIETTSGTKYTVSNIVLQDTLVHAIS